MCRKTCRSIIWSFCDCFNNDGYFLSSVSSYYTSLWKKRFAEPEIVLQCLQKIPNLETPFGIFLLWILCFSQQKLRWIWHILLEDSGCLDAEGGLVLFDATSPLERFVCCHWTLRNPLINSTERNIVLWDVRSIGGLVVLHGIGSVGSTDSITRMGCLDSIFGASNEKWFR